MGFIANMKIGTKLGYGFGLVMLLLVAIAAIGVTQLNAVSGRMDEVVNDRYVTVALSNTIKNDVNAVARHLRNALLAKPEDFAQFNEQITAGVKSVGDGLSKLQARLKTPDELQAFKAMTEGRAAYGATRDQTLHLVNANDKDQAVAYLFKEVVPVFTAYNKAFDSFIELEARKMDSDGRAALESARAATMLVVVLSCVAVALGAVGAWFITRSITRPIEEAVGLVRVVSSGDLSSRIVPKSTDETGQLITAIKAMNDSLVRVVSTVRNSSDNIATGSAQIATGNADLSQRTEEQASSLQQTAAAMEQLTGTVKNNADTAREATALATTACDVAARGGSVVNEVVGTMEAISAASKKISDIIGVIDGIAFQTNILALNAAVEAARAGEQGRGFAVVASEVRTLAQRSANAAKEIAGLINDSVGKVEAGSRLVGEAGSTMGEIVAQVQRVSGLIREISAATNEQTTGIGQVGDAVTQLDQVTQQNAALVEESAAAAESLKQQAQLLVEAVSVFKLGTPAHQAVL